MTVSLLQGPAVEPVTVAEAKQHCAVTHLQHDDDALDPQKIEMCATFMVEQSLLLALIEKLEASEPGSTARLTARAAELIDREPWSVDDVAPDMGQAIRRRAATLLPLFMNREE